LLQAAIEGDPTDGNAVTTCTDCWQAAMADTLKGMYNSLLKQVFSYRPAVMA